MAEIEIPQPEEMHEKAENPFTKRIALFVAIYAVGLAIAAFGGKNCAKELFLLKQEQARVESTSRQETFNTWGQYQSKSTRESMYRNEITILKAEEKGMTPFPAYRAELLKQFMDEEARMKKDKEELAAKANAIEKKGKEDFEKIEKNFQKYERKDPYFDFAEVLFQLGIVLASVAMLSGKNWPFFLSIALGITATLLMINGFGLFVAIPGLDHGAAHVANAAAAGH
ncbi:MAG: DUF4337 domain-containing protein [Gemmataceae bacterium]